MGFKGKFTWFNSLHQGGRKAISFTLKNTNLLLPATFDAAISDGSNVIPTKYFYGLRIGAGDTLVFNADNEAWDWAQGDFFAILDKNKKIVERWDLNLPMKAPGECKECHGTHKCSHCGGNGKVLNRSLHAYELCQVCRGTGICQTCFIPTRQNSPSSPIYSPQAPAAPVGGVRNDSMIRSQIQELEHKIYLLEQENLNMQRNNQQLTLRSIYDNNLQLMYRYKMEIIKLQSILNSLN